MRYVIATLLSSFTLAPGCSECRLIDDAFELAGDGAIDCGHFAKGTATGEGHACAVEAFERGDAFVLRVELQGTDSHVAQALVGRRDGEVFRLLYDGDPGGGGGDGRPRIQRVHCDAPFTSVVSDADAQSFARLGLVPGDTFVGCGGESDWQTTCE